MPEQLAMQESQEESENQKRKYAEVEKTKSVDKAQKEPNSAESDGDATGTTLEEQTGKNMDRRRKVSYRDDEKAGRIPERRRSSCDDEQQEKAYVRRDSIVFLNLAG